MAKKEEKLKGTFIHGIAASEHLDSSGERIKIEGIDISSLTKDGCLNFEHQSKEASSIIGKITKAKKILKRSDCEDDHQRYFWDKVQLPFLYVAGELFDAVGHQAAKDVAAMLRYDQQADLRKTKRLINFSIEGARLDKRGPNILKCIARKITVTITPCNKVCEAEELKEKDDSGETKKSYGFGAVGHGMHGENFSMVQDLMGKAEIMEPSCQIMEKNAKGYMELGKKDYEPKRTFTPQDAPDKLKTGDRISYKDQPKAKTGEEIYGKQPKEKKFGKSKKKINKAKIDEGKSDKKKVASREWRNDRIPEKGKIKGTPYTQDPLQDKQQGKELKKDVSDKVRQRMKNKQQRYKRKQAVRRAPERSKQVRQRQAPISDPHEREAIADEKRTTMRKAKADKALPEEQREKARAERKKSPQGPGYTEENASARARTREKMKKAFVPTNPDKFGNHGHFKSDQYTSNMRKAIAAGGMGAAPGAKTQGSALQAEEIDKGMAYAASNSATVTPSKSGSFKKSEENNHSKGFWVSSNKERKKGSVVNVNHKDKGDLGPHKVHVNEGPFDGKYRHWVTPHEDKEIGKSEKKEVLKLLSEDAFNNFAKKEQLVQFLTDRLPKLNKKEIEALAKTVAYVHEKKKELKLKKIIDG